MAPKSLAVASSAEATLARLVAMDPAAARNPLQNGTRVQMRLHGVPVGLNVYASKDGGCKVVFDRPESPEADAIAEALGGQAAVPNQKKSAGAIIEPAMAGAACWIGSDESGKGDYFGPLVTAAVAVTDRNWRVLAELGVQDSKSLTDARARTLAGDIVAAFPHEIVTIMPPRYNELFPQMRTVNRMLAWAHARAIDAALTKAPDAELAVADQFGDESLIRDALERRRPGMRLLQMHRGERDPAVAAASLLARAEFLSRLAQLSRRAGLQLPKGAGAQIDAVARALVARDGPDVLSALAKRHFRNTERALQRV